MSETATEVETLLIALYTARWAERDLADWARTYIHERRTHSRVPFGELAVIRLADGWGIVDVDAVRVPDEVDEATS